LVQNLGQVNTPQVEADIRMTRFIVKPFRWVRIVFRGRRGKDKIAVMMFGEYIVFLLILAASAILFWALAPKATVTSTNALSLGTALTISASHFLPAINRPNPSSLPWWADFGPAAKSWVLFVVYIGLVASALPLRQEDFSNRLAFTRQILNLTVQLWHLYRRIVRVLYKANRILQANAD
jgi:hypothetical protein